MHEAETQSSVATCHEHGEAVSRHGALQVEKCRVQSACTRVPCEPSLPQSIHMWRESATPRCKFLELGTEFMKKIETFFILSVKDFLCLSNLTASRRGEMRNDKQIRAKCFPGRALCRHQALSSFTSHQRCFSAAPTSNPHFVCSSSRMRRFDNVRGGSVLLNSGHRMPLIGLGTSSIIGFGVFLDNLFQKRQTLRDL